MEKLIVSAIIISLSSFISVNGKEIEIALEAELAQKIQEPMIVDDDVGKGASNDKFIWMEGNLLLVVVAKVGLNGPSIYPKPEPMPCGDTLLPGMVAAILSG